MRPIRLEEATGRTIAFLKQAVHEGQFRVIAVPDDPNRIQEAINVWSEVDPSSTHVEVSCIWVSTAAGIVMRQPDGSCLR